MANLIERLIAKFNERFVDRQLRKQFKPLKFPKKVMCEYCGKVLVSGSKRKKGDPIRRWVYGDGTAIYSCIACDEHLSQKELVAAETEAMAELKNGDISNGKK